MRSAVRLLALSPSVALNVACNSCESHKPYTPFTIPSAPPPQAPASAASAAPAAGSPFAGRKEELAPPGSARWQVGERELEAPQGQVFERALHADFDADTKEEAVAWLVPADADAGAVPGELWYFPAQGSARRLLPIPPFVPTGPGCKLSVALTQTGPQTVTLDVSAACEAHLVARSPLRALTVLRPALEPAAILTLRLAEPAPGELVTISVDSTDRDGDGRDDVKVAFTLQTSPAGRAAAAELGWLDRAAGTSRESGEPARSLAAAATQELGRARARATTRGSAEAIANLRRLAATLCAESGTARLFDEDGAPLGCGNLQSFVDKTASAEFTAALTQKDLVGAFGVLMRDGWYYGRISDATRKQMQKELDKLVPAVDVTATTLEPEPVARLSLVRYSPLRFEADGRLLVQTPHGLMRVANDGSGSEALDPNASEPKSWPLQVENAQGAQWIGLTYACDRSETLLNLAGASSSTLASELLAPRPGTCRGGSLPRSTPPIPLSFQGTTPEAIVAGKSINAQAERVPAAVVPGSARSPDGQYLAVPSPLGLVIASRERTALWYSADVNWSALEASDCVVANAARAAACISGGRARLFIPKSR